MAFTGSMMTAGGTVEMAPETALATPGAYVHQRLSATNPSFPTDAKIPLDVPHTGHRHWGTREKQLVYEKYREGAITIPTYLARAAGAAASLPQCVQHFRAAGCNIASTDGTPTVAIATSVDSFTLSAPGGTDVGRAGLLGIGVTPNANAYYLPVLPSSFVAPTVTPSMELPAATDIGSDWEVMHTMTPRVGPLAATATNSFRLTNHYQHTAAQMQRTYEGCAVASFADVVFKPGAPIEITPTYHVGRISEPTDATMTTETFQDSKLISMLSCDGECHVNFATFADPVTTNARIRIIDATWQVGFGAVIKEGFGSSACVNAIGTYFGNYTGSKITLHVEMDKTYWTEFAADAEANKYLAITQPITSLTHTAFGLWMPKCRIYGSPTVGEWSDTTLDAEVTFEPTTPLYEADEGITSEGMSPWYFAIGGSAA